MGFIIVLTALFLLWLAFVTTLAIVAFRKYAEKKWVEAIVYTACEVVVLILTAGWALFYLNLIGCELGFDLPCRL